MTKRRNNVIICLIVALVVSVCSFAFTTQAFATEETLAPTTNVFEMEEGGYIRYNMADPGVRFRVRMSEDIKNRAVAENATLGFVISLTEYFTGHENDYLSVSPKLDVESLIVPADKIYLDEDGYYYANAVVGNMLEQNLALQYSCVAYLTEGETAPIYATYSAEVNSRSWQDIASVAFFKVPEFRSQTDYASFGSEELPVLVNATGYNSYSALVDLVKAGNSFENVTFKLTETVEVTEKLGNDFLGTLTYTDGVGVYYAFTGEETETDVKMFTELITSKKQYYVSQYTKASEEDAFVKEGNTAIKLSSDERWPQWHISQDLIDWLTYKEYDYLTFDMWIDQETSGTTVSASGGTASGGVKLFSSFSLNTWVHKQVSVSSLTTNHCIYLNKGAVKEVDVYIDNVQFLKSGEFTGNETVVDLAMFNDASSYTKTVNRNSNFIKEGDTSLKLSYYSRWPKWYISQAFIDWLVENEYTTLTFEVWIDQATSGVNLSSTTNLSTDDGTLMGVKNLVNQWQTVSISVSSLTTKHCIYLNKDASCDMDIYIDNVQFS